MKTIKELEESIQDHEYAYAYLDGYKTAIEGIFNDTTNSQGKTVESIEKYLQDLLIK